MTGQGNSTARAVSKLILLGEHAVVYGHPSVAVPLDEPSSRAEARQGRAGEPVGVELSDFGLAWMRGEAPADDEARPFTVLVERLISEGLAPDNGWTLSVSSKVPIGCGLGSGASVAAAAFRAVCGLFGTARSDRELSDDVFEIEKIHHGAPSGVDNTVVAHSRPVLFRKGGPPSFLSGPGGTIFLAVADTGVRHKTAEVVADISRLRCAQPELFDGIFHRIGELALEGAESFQNGNTARLGELMTENHRLLGRLGVSTQELDRLARAARTAGSLGAKLCGAGRGGCVAALARDADSAQAVAGALLASGAKKAFTARIAAPSGRIVPSGKGERPPSGDLASRGQA
ncbi:MAG: mevalonate kinase [Elusimicrobia bacterium]|nr:mevalonate kinase [Elusimicrobiota bacterium]